MKELVNSLIGNLHYIILIYGLYGTYVQYDEHSTALESIVSQGPGIDAEIVTSQKKMREIQEASKKTDEFKLRVEEVAKNIESVQRQLPAEINDSQILTFFNQEMSSLNIKDPSITPGSEQKSTYYISKEYTLRARGTFLQFLIFLERISNASRIYNIKELRLTAIEDNKKGKFQVLSGEGVFQAFKFNPDFKVDRGFETINKE